MPENTTVPALPPLSQSRQALMACPHLYVSREIEGRQEADNPYALRGTEIHKAIATYVDHLVATRQPSDYSYFDRLLKQGFSAEAVDLLTNMKDGFIIDPDRVLGTELHLQLDSEFVPMPSGLVHPNELSEEKRADLVKAWERDSYTVPAFEGTLDYVQFTDESTAEIWDWKSFFQVIDADTFQSKLYPLLLMLHYPHVQTVHFHLRFVRYGVARSVTYTRDDIQRLQELAVRERDRQSALHREADAGNVLNALPGRHCAWCPNLLKGCPVADRNPYTEQTPEERLRFAIWLKQAAEKNRQILTHLLNVTGPIEVTDDNDQRYRAEFRQTEKAVYPLEQTLETIETWEASSGEDLKSKLFISASKLNSYAKARKREPLARALETVRQVIPGTRFTISGIEDEDEE